MKPWKSLFATALLVLAGGLTVLSAPAAQALENGVARTPPLGWNSWNTFGCNINETLIRQMADAIVSSGMREWGYRYVDCWLNPPGLGRQSAGPPHPVPVRDAGPWRLHPQQRAEFGIYQVPVDRTCAQYFVPTRGATGSRGHEGQDARQFAAWVDYLKYDWCSPTERSTIRCARCGTRWPRPAGRSSTASTPTESTRRPARCVTGARSVAVA